MVIFFAVIILATVLTVILCAFFDQAVFNRPGTIFHLPEGGQKIALTFDDGPSPQWTPLILDELKKYNVKATFFLIGHHVQKYPEIARRIAEEGHTIGNHGYAHSVVVYYTPAEIEEEIKYTELVIKKATDRTTRLYRPPKSWINKTIKQKIKSMGYDTVLWSLNSKDWVGFSYKAMVKFMNAKVKSGDILLFHDSGNVFGTEGGSRLQTVKAVSSLVEILKKRGFEFVAL